MLDFSRVQNYYIACGYTDMRKQIDGLVALVELQFGKKLDEASIFLFCGRRADRIKALYWDGTGYVLLYKRLAEKRFQWPRNEQELKLLTKIRVLLGGFDQLNPRLDGVVFDCGLVHVSAPLQSEFCPNNSEAIGCPLPSTVGRLTSDIPYQRYPDQLDLYVCFLVLWMQKTFHCLAEFFRQLALRRMTAPLNQMQFFSRSRNNIHVILYQPDRTDPVA